MYYANQSIKGEQATETVFDFANGEQTSTEKLEYKGKVYNGKLILHENGEVAVCIDDKEHYAYKNKDSDEIVSGTGTCLYDGTTGDFSSNSGITDLRGKTIVATTITESSDGLNAIIKIPEEGHYDETSEITVPIIEINKNISKINPLTFYADGVVSYNGITDEYIEIAQHQLTGEVHNLWLYFEAGTFSKINMNYYGTWCYYYFYDASDNLIFSGSREYSLPAVDFDIPATVTKIRIYYNSGGTGGNDAGQRPVRLYFS